MELERTLLELGAQRTFADDQLELLPSSVYVQDTGGIVVWANSITRALFGDIVGQRGAGFIDTMYRNEAATRFRRLMLGVDEFLGMDVVLVDREGARLRGTVSATPIKGATGIVGLFGVLHIHERLDEPAPVGPKLSRREAEVLRLLAAGLSTRSIANDLHIAYDTARNHVNALLRRLGAHSRVEAIALARGHGLLPR
jgi:DNA-binding CsgD family transcriptional regulator